MAKQTYSIGGLHCEGCVKSVSAILREQAGTMAVTVELATGRAEIDAAPNFDAGAAIQAVMAAGFSMKAA